MHAPAGGRAEQKPAGPVRRKVGDDGCIREVEEEESWWSSVRPSTWFASSSSEPKPIEPPQRTSAREVNLSWTVPVDEDTMRAKRLARFEKSA